MKQRERAGVGRVRDSHGRCLGDAPYDLDNNEAIEKDALALLAVQGYHHEKMTRADANEAIKLYAGDESAKVPPLQDDMEDSWRCLLRCLLPCGRLESIGAARQRDWVQVNRLESLGLRQVPGRVCPYVSANSKAATMCRTATEAVVRLVGEKKHVNDCGVSPDQESFSRNVAGNWLQPGGQLYLRHQETARA